MKKVALIGTFDTKGEELSYIRQLLEERELEVFSIDCGLRSTQSGVDVPPARIFERAGQGPDVLEKCADKYAMMQAMTQGMCHLLPELYQTERFDGVLAIGGSGGTSIAAAGMRQLPLGVPKLIVSTMAGGDVSRFVGISDIVLLPSIVDMAGLNAVLRHVFRQAVAAMAGMVQAGREIAQDRPQVAVTMFGVTTHCVMEARRHLLNAGFEVLVFHANGMGGRLMEQMIAQGKIAGVLDLTTTELCDERFGGILSAGPDRLLAAGQYGVPQVVSVGAVDIVNFGNYADAVHNRAGRKFYRHNVVTTLMRTTCEENAIIGREMAAKLNRGCGRTTVLFPLRGISDLDRPGMEFYGQAEDAALLRALREGLDLSRIGFQAVDAHINDPEFAQIAAQELIRLMKERV